MQNYDFAVLKGDQRIVAQWVSLPDPHALWPRVVELAGKFDEPGCRIRVTNEAGHVVILIGATAACQSPKH